MPPSAAWRLRPGPFLDPDPILGRDSSCLITNPLWCVENPLLLLTTPTRSSLAACLSCTLLAVYSNVAAVNTLGTRLHTMSRLCLCSFPFPFPYYALAGHDQKRLLPDLFHQYHVFNIKVHTISATKHAFLKKHLSFTISLLITNFPAIIFYSPRNIHQLSHSIR